MIGMLGLIDNNYTLALLYFIGHASFFKITTS